MGIARGMRHIHSRNIIQRDPKTGSILLGREHHACVADFGSSRFDRFAAMVTTISGTSLYMAPEQYESTYDRRVDVFSFGLILYESFQGKPVSERSLTMPQLLSESI
jgi:serine/threonine protein kinase